MRDFLYGLFVLIFLPVIYIWVLPKRLILLVKKVGKKYRDDFGVK